MVTIHKQMVMLHPIIDNYYKSDPSYVRNSKFAVSKGLVSNAPGIAQTLTPALTPSASESDTEAAA